MTKVPFPQALQQIRDRLILNQEHADEIDKFFNQYKDTSPCAALYRLNFTAHHNLLAELLETSLFTREEYQEFIINHGSVDILGSVIMDNVATCNVALLIYYNNGVIEHPDGSRTYALHELCKEITADSRQSGTKKEDLDSFIREGVLMGVSAMVKHKQLTDPEYNLFNLPDPDGKLPYEYLPSDVNPKLLEAVKV